MSYIGNAPTPGLSTSATIQDGTIDTIDIKDAAITANKLSLTAIADKLGFTPIGASTIETLTNKTIDSYTNSVGADHIHFKVKATTAITKGQILKIVGYNQGEDAIEVAPWNSQSDTAVAIAHSNIVNGEFGLGLHAGIIEGVNTSAFSIGQILYPASNGTLTATKPTTGNYQAVAFVLKSNSNNGALLVEFTEPTPVLSTVATSGSYNDLLNKPILSTVATSGSYNDLLNKPTLSTVATSGSYNDLLNKPTLGTAASTASTDYATAAQGILAENALPSSGGTLSGGLAGTSGSFSGNLSATNGRLVLRDDSLENHATASDSGVAVNYYGYQSSTTYFRDFNVYDGKGNLRFKTYASDNYAYAPASFRAPIFYDSNDTGYYIDPAGVSRSHDWLFVRESETTAEQLEIRVNGGISTGNYSGIKFTQGSTYLGGLRIKYNSSGQPDYAFNLRSHTDALLIHNSNYIQASGSFRAPIFYDSNDTGYYVDPASTSILNTIYFSVLRNPQGHWILGPQDETSFSIGSAALTDTMYVDVDSIHFRYGSLLKFFSSANNERGYIQATETDDNHFIIAASGGEDIVFKDGGVNGDRNMVIRGTGVVESYGDFRSPIFYDSNDTSYYCNPNSSSNLYDLNATRLLTQGDTKTYDFGANLLGGYYYGYGTSNVARHEIMRVGIDYNDWNSVGSIIIELSEKYYSQGGYSKWHIGYGYVSSSSLSLIDAQGSWGGARVSIGSQVQISGDSYYLPIYVDVKGYHQFSAKITTTRNLTDNSLPGTGLAVILYSKITSDLGTTSITSQPYAYINNGFYADGDLYGSSSIRSPIFYDQNNTTYYVDPNDTGTSVRVAGNVTTYYSDERLKNILGPIDNPLDKLKNITGFYYEENETAEALGYKKRKQVGVSAQKVQEVLPEIVTDAPINANYLTIDYSKLTPLLIEAIKELAIKLEKLENKHNL